MYQDMDIATRMLASRLAFPWRLPGITDHPITMLVTLLTRQLLPFLHRQSISNKTAAPSSQGRSRIIGGTTVKASKVIIPMFRNVPKAGNVLRRSLRT